VSIEKLRQEENVTVSWSFFPLHPETPPEGKSLSDLFKGRESQVQSFQNQIKSLAEKEGLPYGDRSMTYNSRLAQELGSWADTQANGEALHDVLYRSYFVDNVNISDIDVLVRLAGQAGLKEEEARDVLQDRRFSQKVDEDWQRARGMGLSGVPTFVSSELYVVGCQTYDVLMRFLSHLRKLKSEAKTNSA